MKLENKKQLFEASLKTLETENIFDRFCYRPIGYQIAIRLKNTSITPNMITVISMFFGVAAGYCFYYNSLYINVIGIGLLIFTNLLDCVDGQLARLTGIKSQIGRILDGFASDVWFVAVYTCLALRLYPALGSTAWILAALAGASNLVQSNVVDYYKTLHLYFISLEKGAEFESAHSVRQRYEQMPKGINRIFFRLYLGYTMLQTFFTPKLQMLLSKLDEKYGRDYPEDVRKRLRGRSLKLMPLINIMTFNWRSVVLFASLLAGYVWIYFVYEILILNIVLICTISKHEKFCSEFEV